MVNSAVMTNSIGLQVSFILQRQSSLPLLNEVHELKQVHMIDDLKRTLAGVVRYVSERFKYGSCFGFTEQGLRAKSKCWCPDFGRGFDLIGLRVHSREDLVAEKNHVHNCWSTIRFASSPVMFFPLLRAN